MYNQNLRSRLTTYIHEGHFLLSRSLLLDHVLSCECQQHVLLWMSLPFYNAPSHKGPPSTFYFFLSPQSRTWTTSKQDAGIMLEYIHDIHVSSATRKCTAERTRSLDEHIRYHIRPGMMERRITQCGCSLLNGGHYRILDSDGMPNTCHPQAKSPRGQMEMIIKLSVSNLMSH